MKTIILPGYSEKNKDWAEATAKEMKKDGFEMVVHNWDHWDQKVSFSEKKEINRILGEVGIADLNIIAKSVGVQVALQLIPIIPVQVKKVILCGIASVNEERKTALEKVLQAVSSENILCIQNEKDRFIPYPEAEKFYHSVDPKLKVIEKPRSDHQYPFSEDFIRFLKAN